MTLSSLTPLHAAGRWADASAHPWRRYAARTLDNVVVGFATWAAVGFVAYAADPKAAGVVFAMFSGPRGAVADAFLTVIVVIPGNALTIGLTGLSLGKWIFGVRVLRDGRPIGLRDALRREAQVWWQGLGCGLPFVSLFTLINAYRRLSDDEHTAWDAAQGNLVVHRPQSVAATVGMAGAAALLAAVIVLQRFGPMLAS